MHRSKLFLFVIALLLPILAQGMRPSLADDTVAAQPVSFSPDDPMSLSPATKIKKLRIACYPQWAECTKDSDCCTGFCRAGRVAAYCDN
jgi:hypothetical protein